MCAGKRLNDENTVQGNAILCLKSTIYLSLLCTTESIVI